MITGAGKAMTLDSGQKNLLGAVRSSYGVLGVITEATLNVQPQTNFTASHRKMTIGDLIATFKNGESIATQVAINAHVDLQVLPAPGGGIRLDVGAPVTYVDILDENIDGANALSNAQFEAVATFALSRVVAVGSGAVGIIPLPSAGGVAVQDVKVSQQAGYLVVDGDVE